MVFDGFVYLLGPPKGCCFVGFMYQKTIKNPQNKTLWVVLVGLRFVLDDFVSL